MEKGDRKFCLLFPDFYLRRKTVSPAMVDIPFQVIFMVSSPAPMV